MESAIPYIAMAFSLIDMRIIYKNIYTGKCKPWASEDDILHYDG